MKLSVINGRLKKQVYGCSLYHPQRATLLDYGKVPKTTTFNKIMCFMSRLEDQGKTEHWTYVQARKMAYNHV